MRIGGFIPTEFVLEDGAEVVIVDGFRMECDIGLGGGTIRGIFERAGKAFPPTDCIFICNGSGILGGGIIPFKN